MALAVPRYTLADLDRFPDDGQRYELVEGMLIVTPAPGMGHEIVVHRLHLLLGNFLDAAGMAHVVGRSEVEQRPRTHLEPDLLVLPSRFPPDTPWNRVDEWWLAVEVLSGSSRVYDREIKAAAYLAIGVAEVWLVDLKECLIEVRRPGTDARVLREELFWQPPAGGPSLTVNLNHLFRGVGGAE